jgi:hypothetical protein
MNSCCSTVVVPSAFYGHCTIGDWHDPAILFYLQCVLAWLGHYKGVEYQTISGSTEVHKNYEVRNDLYIFFR